MQVAVRNRALASQTFLQLLAAEPAGESHSAYLNATRLRITVGQSEFELCEPAGAGRVQTHLDNWGEGLMTAGYATSKLGALTDHFDTISVPYTREGEQVYLSGDVTAGFPMVISPLTSEIDKTPGGPISFLYEATNTLDTDWRVVADNYVKLFGLDPARFCEIANERFAYAGTLTLFDPPARPDRIELSQTFSDKSQPMRRFVERRGGDSLYMCFAEARDFDGLKSRLLEAGATLATRGQILEAERDSMWVHPKNLHGVLLGISRTGFAWNWSGHPELVPRLRE